MSGQLDRLRHRVELFRKDQLIDGAGGLVQTHVSLGMVWAQIVPGTPRRADLGGARTAQSMSKICIRFRSDLSPGDRITFGTSNFRIVSLQNVEGRSVYLDCICQEESIAG